MLVKVLNWKMDGVYTNLGVVFHHLILFDSPEAQVTMRLHVEDACYARLEECVDIVLRLRVWSQPYLRIAYFVEAHLANKVCISLFDVAVYDKAREDVSREVRSFLTELAFVFIWIKDS